jgi:hypothetical protein
MTNASKLDIQPGTQVMVITAFGHTYPGVVNKSEKHNGKKWYEVTWNFMDLPREQN